MLKFRHVIPICLLATNASAQTVIDWSGWTSSWSNQRVVVEAARKSLADPVSAQIQSLHAPKNQYSNGVCGEVNAKGQLGAYTGFRPFYVDRTEGRMVIPKGILDTSIGQHGC